jgi:hypothetical protein
MLAFRDSLRTHIDDRLLYEQTKRDLAYCGWRENSPNVVWAWCWSSIAATAFLLI